VSHAIRRALFALASVSAAALSLPQAQPAFAASHADVTPYRDLQTRLKLKPGQTYLHFMQTQVKPGLDAFEQTIQNDPANRARRYGKLQQNLIAQGAGVAIRIDGSNYIFNVGYLDGSDPENDIKSGRSYGVGPAGAESDPSDLAYLKELEAYLGNEPDAVGDFVEAIMKVVTDCDASLWTKLSEDGQAVATDFLAIYTAELDRHLMVDLNPRRHPWEIDLAAATFVSVFNTASGLMMQDGSLTQGTIQDWWAKGTAGSGIGETRRDRIALQKMIAENEAGTQEARQIAKLVGADADGDDLIQAALLYLNSSNAPAEMGDDAGKLSRAMRDYLVNVQAHSDQIAALR
jgi:hypothetical protein